jgi:hypothetical protein
MPDDTDGGDSSDDSFDTSDTTGDGGDTTWDYALDSTRQGTGDDSGTGDDQGENYLNGAQQGGGPDDQADPDWADKEAQHHDDFQPDYARQYAEQMTPMQKVDEGTVPDTGEHWTSWLSPDGTKTDTFDDGTRFVERPDGPIITVDAEGNER